MKTRVIPASEPEWLEAALAILREGGVVAFPTDTVYGVGADPLREDAVEALYRAKGRPSEKAIPLLLSDAQQMEQVVRDVPPAAQALARCFWPGALSMVLPAREEVPAIVRAGGETLALRMPDHPVALRLIAAFGWPLAVTSANRSGQPSPATAEEVLAQLGGRVPLVVDGGRCPGGKPSTVLDLTVHPPRILRPGSVTWEDVQACLGSLQSS
ncbi:MAG: threonylcarbamoyl-AMP synthase [Anaerolineae bacterium]|nr:threonylcarbamoyl-AMP synthase [Anaerolineae bacterium]